jgi:hypothetical protein
MGGTELGINHSTFDELVGPPRMPLTRKAPPQQGLSGTGATGLEPATSAVTGQRSNQLSYAPAMTLQAGDT